MSDTARDLFPPGEYISDELEARGWAQETLADIIGRSSKFVSQLIAGKKRIEPRTAKELAAAFGTSAELWMNLESAYRLGIEQNEQDEVVRRARLYDIAPIRDMLRRRWIRDCGGTELEHEVGQFFADSPGPAAARKSSPYDVTTPSQRAWLQRAYQLAKSAPGIRPYSRALAERTLDQLHALTVSEQEVRKIPSVLADMGIRFVVVEPLPRSKMDGAVMWINEESPVIAVSVRYDRIDGFWHTLCHELAHILRGDAWSVDDDMVGNDKLGSSDGSEQERAADAAASDFLIPRAQLDSFITRHKPRFSKVDIVRFANLHQIHPGIVVGQLQHRGAIRYSHSREMLVSVRNILTDASITDGWGHTAEI